MDYDFRNRLNPQYNSQFSMYNRPTRSYSSSPLPQSAHPMYGLSSLYSKIGQSAVPPPPRNKTTPNSAGMGIRVTLNPEFRITQRKPQISPHIGEIPRSTFQFDFELERKILAEAEKENPNWSKLGLENHPHKTARAISRANSSVDPVVGKCIATGLNRDAVPIGVAKFGDNPTKVKEFVNGYTVLREMGFEANSIAEALFTHNNDKEAAAHFLSSSS